MLREEQAPESTGERQELSTELAMGGQALIEGVLMRSPHRVAIAVRTPDSTIAIKSYAYVPITRRNKFAKLPIIRGAVGLVESMKIGLEALEWSAEKASGEELKPDGKPKLRDRIGLGISFVVATVMALGLFLYFPLWIGRLVAGGDASGSVSHQIIINAVAGAVRITVLILYLAIISLWKDIHRVFQYHGSEHKSIYALEKGVDLAPSSVLRMSRFHPRCGTSFLLIVALSAILFFVIVDSLIVAVFGEYPSVLARFAVHLPLIPLVAGISYEFLKYSAKHTENKFVKLLIMPGLWLQRITTQEPDEGMCEVAVAALKAALAKEDQPSEPVKEPAETAL
jgi:uncharacterized protein YqhQ